MSTATIPVRRHALGLPAGSVRAAQVLGIVALVCAFILVPKQPPLAIPPYLIYLLFVMLGHFFAAHGVSIATRDDPSPSPLFLPGGAIRFIVLAALIGSVGWKLYSDAAGLETQYESSLTQLQAEPYLPLVILGAFLVGVIIRSLLGWNAPSWWQDFEAWFSLIALVLLAIAALIHFGIGLTLPEQLHLPMWEAIVGGVIAFYFGERS